MFASVSLDEFTGMERAVRHLVDLGHQCIAYVRGPIHSWSGKRRKRAFLTACDRIGVRAETIGPFEASYQGGSTAADALSVKREITAAMALNDVIASGLVARLERGINVPRDMSVIGVDDSLVARAMRPQLTSIDNRQRDIGEMAVRLLLAKIDHRIPESSIGQQPTLAGTLIIRGSTGSAARNA